MFVSATNWQKATDAVQSTKIVPNDEPQKCVLKGAAHSDDCVQQLSKATLKASSERRHLDAFFEVAIPVFQFRRISQFDFVKNGGILIPATFPESALNSYSFTWDLKKLIAPATTRLDAHKAFEAYKTPSTESERSSQKVCVTIGQTTNFITVLPTFTVKSCNTIAKGINATRYALACTSADNVQSADSVAVDENAGAPKSNKCNW
jgi:hypothetical protein